MFPYVDAGSIAQMVAAWTGIPIGRMVSDEIQTVLNAGRMGLNLPAVVVRAVVFNTQRATVQRIGCSGLSDECFRHGIGVRIDTGRKPTTVFQSGGILRPLKQAARPGIVV